jgi:hypothetical protein
VRAEQNAAWPARPVIYEVNAWVWLHDVSLEHGRHCTLLDVPDDAWDSLMLPGVNAVWLMGVWTRSVAGRAIAISHPAFLAEMQAVLPDLTDADIIGSAYSLAAYEVDVRLGGSDGLAAARAALQARGMRLVLDLVPNHVGPDHAWVHHPDRVVVEGTADDLAAIPTAWLDVGGKIVARARDPFFPPWSDVVQLNAFSPTLRRLIVDTIRTLGDQCDGLRCDMAMLALDDVFAATWAGHVGPPLAQPFWVEVITAVRSTHPELMFMAEAYWDREGDLLAQGFELCYDKHLYDYLVHPDPEGARRRVAMGDRLVRFIENHDEQRAAAVFGREAERAALVTVTTAPGALLLHEGQVEGRRVRVPVHLARRPVEPIDDARKADTLVVLAATASVRAGEWERCAVTGWAEDQSFGQLLAWSSRTSERDYLVVVNLADRPAHARVQWKPPHTAVSVKCLDLLTGTSYERAADELEREGLFVALPPWGTHVLTT